SDVAATAGKSRLLDQGGQPVGEAGGGPAGVLETAGPGGQVGAGGAGGQAAQVEGDGRQAALQAGPEQVGGDQLVAGRAGQAQVGQLGRQGQAVGGQLGGGQGDLGGVGGGGLGGPGRARVALGGPSGADRGHHALVDPGVGPLLLDQGGPQPVGLVGQPVQSGRRLRVGLPGADPGRHGDQR